MYCRIFRGRVFRVVFFPFVSHNIMIYNTFFPFIFLRYSYVVHTKFNLKLFYISILIYICIETLLKSVRMLYIYIINRIGESKTKIGTYNIVIVKIYFSITLFTCRILYWRTYYFVMAYTTYV